MEQPHPQLLSLVCSLWSIATFDMWVLVVARLSKASSNIQEEWPGDPHATFSISFIQTSKLKDKAPLSGYCVNNSSLSEKMTLGPKERSQRQAFSPLSWYITFYFANKAMKRDFVVETQNKDRFIACIQ